VPPAIYKDPGDAPICATALRGQSKKNTKSEQSKNRKIGCLIE
jgi:hypothetical protein